MDNYTQGNTCLASYAPGQSKTDFSSRGVAMKKDVTRRDFLKGGVSAVGALAAAEILLHAEPALSAIQGERASITAPNNPQVYFTKELNAKSLQKMYRLVSSSLTGKVAVKLHTGEPHGPNIIPVSWVKELLPEIPNGTVVETNVFYDSPRQTTQGHRETLLTNGWDFCTVDILDADGDVNLPVKGGKWFKEIAMGKNIMNYDSMLVLTHFKGHTMGGFGGSMKNIAIGCASGKVGKKQLHQKGGNMWGYGCGQQKRTQSFADA